jgi:hypothetical protein
VTRFVKHHIRFPRVSKDPFRARRLDVGPALFTERQESPQRTWKSSSKTSDNDPTGFEHIIPVQIKANQLHERPREPEPAGIHPRMMTKIFEKSSYRSTPMLSMDYDETASAHPWEIVPLPPTLESNARRATGFTRWAN